MNKYYWYCTCGCMSKKLYGSRSETQKRAARHKCGGEIQITYTRGSSLPKHPTWKRGYAQ